MTIPLLSYPLTSQNQRVEGFERPGDEYLPRYVLDTPSTGAEVDAAIAAAYRQVFSEQQTISAHRKPILESQLRNNLISMRGFIQGLVLSDSFRRLNYEANNNYRFVELCFQRLLGRPTYDRQEQLAWSIVLASRGLVGFVEALLYGKEYEENFGEFCVPYQRRRILPQRDRGNLPVARMARYDRQSLDPQGANRMWLVGNAAIDRSADLYRNVIFFVPSAAVAALVATLILVTAP
ncbi:phycobilisome linker polypeptide [Rubidibacter lacunae KORDI 51-2]|uniref:Phycobilisome linker polypeptide n=1 Tax=Rubidibacter lacunae KORDI 51-2 TaxID=582515 RepID=U5DN57_9CHRO|nr:phycobilisome rod-core linker polypeptide [Rubidibacter lacunae]ERN42297.1 phycobilisome linker polypeptide [Rubidibacter lacunae KORDI 51-2]